MQGVFNIMQKKKDTIPKPTQEILGLLHVSVQKSQLWKGSTVGVPQPSDGQGLRDFIHICFISLGEGKSRWDAFFLPELQIAGSG